MHGNRRISDIECLRGIAVVLVLITHARGNLFVWQIPSWDHIVDHYFNFWAGVDLFFAISGFVIARSLLPTLQACRNPAEFLQAVAVFWLRRVWRLLPSAWLWLAITLAGAAVFNRFGLFDTFHANFESTIAGLLSIANIRFADAYGHYGYGASSHYWSLSLEEQFYLVLPVVVFLCRSRLPLALLAAVTVVFCLPQTTLLMTFRVHAILLGVLLAIFSGQPGHALFEPVFLARRPLLGPAVLLFLLGLITALAVFGQRIASDHFVDLIAVLCAILVLIASYDRDYLFPYPALRGVMRWLGSRSYALYLVHVFVFIATRELWLRLSPPNTAFGPDDALKLGATALLLLLGCAELNYRLVEQPLRKYGIAAARRLARRQPSAPAIVREPEPLIATAALENELPASS